MAGTTIPTTPKITEGVFPGYLVDFYIGDKGLASVETDMVMIDDIESLALKIDNTIEKWTPFNLQGWTRALVTGKAAGITIKGKRSIGSPGNDYIAGLAFKNGQDASTKATIVMPDGTKIDFSCCVGVTNIGVDDSTKVAALEAELTFDGKPTVTPHTTTT